MKHRATWTWILGVALVGIVLGVNTPALEQNTDAHANDPPVGAWAATGIPGLVAHASNWIPGSAAVFAGFGDIEYGEVLGDMWAFNCPRNGTFSIDLDVMDDNGRPGPFVWGTSNIVPVVEVRDRRGNLLVVGFDNVACNIDPACGSLVGCPRIIDFACGDGNPHAITIYSDPTFTCRGGGGYQLGVSARKANGRDVPLNALRLGGGPNRIVPAWVAGVPKRGPALDDEGVDSGLFPTFP